MASPEMLDDLWKQGLGALAPARAYDADARTRVLARAARNRARRNVVQGVAVLVIVTAVSLGVVAAVRGGGDNTGRPAAQPPTTAAPVPDHVIDIAATAELRFDPDRVSVPAGLIEVRLHDRADGLHTLVFDDRPDFVLQVRNVGDIATGTIRLEPGTYGFSCTIPGHREAGEVGTITVTEH